MSGLPAAADTNSDAESETRCHKNLTISDRPGSFCWRGMGEEHKVKG